MRNRPRATLIVVALSVAGCGGDIATGRYGVRDVEFEGVEQVDSESIRACLGTRQLPHFTTDLGLRGTPACGEPPFDGDHLILRWWAWLWTDWPLFDQSVFERDLARIERWYRARGFYEARVDGEVEPEQAVTGDGSCEEGSSCQAHVRFRIEEGEPILVERMSIRGLDGLPDDMRQRLRNSRQLQRGDRFDEALYQRTKQEMLTQLANAGYARAQVRGDVKLNYRRREAYLAFYVEAGPPSVIGRVCVRGYGDLPPRPMLAVANLEAGARFSYDALEDAQHALYRLGVFSGVEVRPAPRLGASETSQSTTGNDDDASSTEAGAQSGPSVVDPDNAEVTVGTSQHRLCDDGPSDVEEGNEAVDIDIRVTPGRTDLRMGYGIGLQAGQAVTFGTVTSFADQQNAAQWDLHLSAAFEHRNAFDNLSQWRLEVRPRLIFEMPALLNWTPAYDPPLGVQAVTSIRWPAFIEARTNLLFQLRDDLGPMPFTNFFRNELDGLIGLERTFFDGRLYTGVFVHGNWFVPTDRQPANPRDELPQVGALWLEEVIRVDLRDNPRNPTEGIYFSLSGQQAVQPLSTWDFVRVTGEVRGYIPLPFGIVIAGRFELGVMEVLGFDNELNPANAYQLHQLGPPALQLRGGGASSNRGFLPGLVGDAEQVYVTLPRNDQEIAAGIPPSARAVRISGGTRLWEASLEVRIPITTSFGVVLFADAGDVDRLRLSAPEEQGVTFRFDHPQFAFGLGVRYRTVFGPIRLDVGVRPDELQVLTQNNQLPPTCSSVGGSNCRPLNRTNLALFDFPGAFQLTIGEAF